MKFQERTAISDDNGECIPTVVFTAVAGSLSLKLTCMIYFSCFDVFNR